MHLPNYRKFLTPAAVAFTAIAIAACGGGSGSTANQASADLDGGAAGVNFSMQTAGARNADAKALATKSESEHGHDGDMVDGAGTPIALTEVRVHVRDLEFFLPAGIRCEDVQFTFIDPVRCDGDDDDDGDVADDDGIDDDDGTPDQGPGDLAKFSEADDDGTADQGSGDVEDDDQAGDDDDQGEDEDHDEGDKVVVEGPFIADLLAGTATPSLTTILIPSGLYTRIDVRIDQAKEKEGLLDASDPLLERSLFARGTFPYQDADHELRVRLKFNEDVRFRNDAGVALSETAANDVVVTLDESVWLAGIDLAGCLDSGDLVLEEDGSLLIDEQTGTGACQHLEQTIRNNIEASGGTF